MDTNSKEARESLGGNEAEDVLRRYALLKKISLALGSSLVPEELFRTIAAEIMKAVPYNRCLIAYVNPHSTGYIYWHVESDVGIPERKSGEYRDPGTWLFKNVYETKTPVYIPDILASGVHWLKMLGDAGLRSSAFIPILQDGECTAHLALSSLSRDAYSKRQLDLLVDVASLIGPAIRNASLYQEARIRASHLEISGEIAKAVGSELEPDE
jgi:GAF domain-containing protein